MKASKLMNIFLAIISINLTLLTLSQFNFINVDVLKTEKQKKQDLNNKQPYIIMNNGKLYYWSSGQSLKRWVNYKFKDRIPKIRDYGGIDPIIYTLPNY